MAQVPSGSSRHSIKYTGYPDEYIISWRVAYKYGRLLHYVTRSRDTNRRGAERFAKKWKITIPLPPEKA